MTLKPITIAKFKWIPTGDADFATIKKNLDDIVERLNDTISAFNTERDHKDKFMRTVLIDSATPITILEAGSHSNLKIVSGFVMAADNLKMQQTIEIQNTKGQSLVEPRTLKATEKSGKAQSFELIPWRTIGKFDSIDVVPSSVRKVVVSVLVEEIRKQ